MTIAALDAARALVAPRDVSLVAFWGPERGLSPPCSASTCGLRVTGQQDRFQPGSKCCVTPGKLRSLSGPLFSFLYRGGLGLDL